MLAEVAHLLVIYIYSPIATRCGVYFLHGPRSCLRPFRKSCDCDSLSSRCVGVGAGWGRAGEQVMVGQVGRRAFWHIKCTVGKSGAVGVANCFPPNASGRAWWGVVGRCGAGVGRWGRVGCSGA